tara:strand:- start:37 stop:2298 length:2262 start_codon:yes stop_codon:yes gene_type:complete
MSAYKQFTTKDVTITPFDPNKGFSFGGSSITGSISDYTYPTYNSVKFDGWVEDWGPPYYPNSHVYRSVKGVVYNSQLKKFVAFKPNKLSNNLSNQVKIYILEPDGTYTFQTTNPINGISKNHIALYSSFTNEYYYLGNSSGTLKCEIYDSNFTSTFNHVLSTSGTYDNIGIIDSTSEIYFTNSSLGPNDEKIKIFNPSTNQLVASIPITTLSGGVYRIIHHPQSNKFIVSTRLSTDFFNPNIRNEVFVVDNFGSYSVRKLTETLPFSEYFPGTGNSEYQDNRSNISIKDNILNYIHYNQSLKLILDRYDILTESLINSITLDIPPAFNRGQFFSGPIFQDNSDTLYLVGSIDALKTSGVTGFNPLTGEKVFSFNTHKELGENISSVYGSDGILKPITSQYFDPITNTFALYTGDASPNDQHIVLLTINYPTKSEIIKSKLEGIEIYSGVKPSSNLFISSSSTPTGIAYTENTTGIYNSVKHLYYSNYLSSSRGDLAITQSIIPGVNPEDDRFVGEINAPRYENYLQSTLTQSRHFPTSSGDEISVISIPTKLYGNNIVPQTFEFNFTSSEGNGYGIKDDGEGNLILSNTSSGLLPFGKYGTAIYGTNVYGSGNSSSPLGNLNDVVGQIFYSHGLATFTTGALAPLGRLIDEDSTFKKLERVDLSYSSSVRIYENQYKCKILENEYGYSQNPSILSGSFDDVYYGFATGSEFTPYVTTVGLYNEVNELLVVGKLSMPVPVSQFVDTTIIVNFDT